MCTGVRSVNGIRSCVFLTSTAELCSIRADTDRQAVFSAVACAAKNSNVNAAVGADTHILLVKPLVPSISHQMIWWDSRLLCAGRGSMETKEKYHVIAIHCFLHLSPFSYHNGLVISPPSASASARHSAASALSSASEISTPSAPSASSATTAL